MRTAVLLGAGASRDAGIPVTAEMTKDIYDRTSGGPFAGYEDTRMGKATSSPPKDRT